MIVVVEPHADDAYLSLGAHIERWVTDGERVAIVTVFSGTRRRAEDAERYAEAVGAEWIGLGHVERGGQDLGPIEFDRPLDLPEGDRILPLGLHHPEHKAVAAQAGPDDGFYVETPYQLVAKHQAELNELVAGRAIVSWLHAPARKWRHHSLFKDQARFMFQNPPSRLGNSPEVIVR